MVSQYCIGYASTYDFFRFVSWPILTLTNFRLYSSNMKRPFHSISLQELDKLVQDACMNAAAESLARNLPVTGIDENNVVITCLPGDPRVASLQSRVDAILTRLAVQIEPKWENQ